MRLGALFTLDPGAGRPTPVSRPNVAIDERERIALLLEAACVITASSEAEGMWDGLRDVLERLIPHRGSRFSIPEFELNEFQGVESLSQSEVPVGPSHLRTGFLRLYRPDGELFEAWEISALQVLGHHLDTWISAIDARRQLIQAGKLTALGQLAAGVAHDLASPLAATLLGIELCLDGLPDAPPTVVSRLQKIRSATLKAQATAGRLLSYARKEQPKSTVFDLDAVVIEAVELVEHHLHMAQAECTLELCNETTVSGHRNELHQVVTNLLINAMDACASQPPERRVILLRTCRNGNQVQLQVIDHGEGILPEDLARIFNPFFTTKKTGQGTGLGLSICQEIVERHGGLLSLESVREKGTTAILSLPAHL